MARLEHVAIIDDDPAEAVILEFMFEDNGYSLHCDRFATVEAFLASRRHTEYVLLFLDRRIPPINQFEESVPLILELLGNANVAVVLMTAHTFERPSLPPDSRLIGPIEKLSLIEPDTFDDVLQRASIITHGRIHLRVGAESP